MTEGAIGGEPTAVLIQEELESERDWRRSLEQRALSLFAIAGVIASLAGIAVRGASLEMAAKIPLALGFGAFAVGAIFGLSVAYPVLVPAVDRRGLARAIEPEEWEQPPEAHLRRASRVRLRILGASRDENQKKAKRLRWAVWCAAAGIALLLAAIIVALFTAEKMDPLRELVKALNA
jgi:hypothetical protein